MKKFGMLIVMLALMSAMAGCPSSVYYAPVAYNVSFSTAENTPVEILLNAVDCHGRSDNLWWWIEVPPQHGVLEYGTPLFYIPDPGFKGMDSFTYYVDDGISDSPLATATVTVGANQPPTNHAPVANPLSVSTAFNTEVNLNLTGSDIDGDVLDFSLVSSPVNGTLSGTMPHLMYTPRTGSSGTDSFQFQVSDGEYASLATATVTVGGALIVIPTTVSLAASQTSGQGPLVVNFTTTASCDISREITEYSWDFGSGFVSGFSTATHTYTAGGTYTATVKVTDSVGGSAQSSVTITVGEGEIVPTIVLINADRTIGNAPLTINFVPEVSCDPSRTIASWWWDFGQGLVADESTASHTYTTAGVYNALVKVVDSEGNFAISTVEIVVEQ